MEDATAWQMRQSMSNVGTAAASRKGAYMPLWQQQAPGAVMRLARWCAGLSDNATLWQQRGVGSMLSLAHWCTVLRAAVLSHLVSYVGHEGSTDITDPEGCCSQSHYCN